MQRSLTAEEEKNYIEREVTRTVKFICELTLVVHRKQTYTQQFAARLSLIHSLIFSSSLLKYFCLGVHFFSFCLQTHLTHAYMCFRIVHVHRDVCKRIQCKQIAIVGTSN